jgi:hypothetical protein
MRALRGRGRVSCDSQPLRAGRSGQPRRVGVRTVSCRRRNDAFGIRHENESRRVVVKVVPGRVGAAGVQPGQRDLVTPPTLPGHGISR